LIELVEQTVERTGHQELKETPELSKAELPKQIRNLD